MYNRQGNVAYGHGWVSRESPLTERDGRKASDALTASGVCGRGREEGREEGREGGVATATTND